MKVVLFPNFNKKNALECTVSACKILLKLGVKVFADKKYKDEISNENVEYGDFQKLAKDCDIIIAIGGDGTILKCSKIAGNVPILGINSGRLGFMASVELEELPLMSNLQSGNFSTTRRMMLKIVHKSSASSREYLALNDVVVSHPFSKLCDFEIFANSRLVSQTRADGVVFSTPTGSTAYSLSAGGPIIEPDMSCIEFTPICPHSLFSRTTIFSDDKTLRIIHNNDNLSSIYFSVDGMDSIPFGISDELFISKSEKFITLIDLKENSFYNSINRKLMQPIKENS